MGVWSRTAEVKAVIQICMQTVLCVTGLSLLNLSLDTLRADRFEQMTRRRGHERVLETLDLALSLGFDPVKVGSLFLF